MTQLSGQDITNPCWRYADETDEHRHEPCAPATGEPPEKPLEDLGGDCWILLVTSGSLARAQGPGSGAVGHVVQLLEESGYRYARASWPGRSSLRQLMPSVSVWIMSADDELIIRASSRCTIK